MKRMEQDTGDKIGQLRNILGVKDSDSPSAEEVFQAIQIVLAIIGTTSQGLREELLQASEAMLIEVEKDLNRREDLLQNQINDLKTFRAGVERDREDNTDDEDITLALERLEEQSTSIAALKRKVVALSKTPSRGKPGRSPAHEWDGTKLRFKSPDGEWGEWVDLRGFPGISHDSGWGSGMGVQRIRAGTGVTVSGDPGNPIISASNSGGTWILENVSGVIDGSNKIFMLSIPPVSPNSVNLSLARQPQIQGVDYTLSGSTITYVVAPDASLSGFPHIAQYQ